ncbi:hypothetical protein [Actinoplanes regularis]|nr:hypothetical protein [Actinoplanes regularis]GIE89724.1 hypothetical protein Are01nite_62040 [Actinoplanes regularis]
MTRPRSQDPLPLIDALSTVRDAVGRCHPMLVNPGPSVIEAMINTATAMSELTELLLREAAPPADHEEPGTGEALERATDLAGDARRHLVTAWHLMAGVRAIAANVAENR